MSLNQKFAAGTSQGEHSKEGKVVHPADVPAGSSERDPEARSVSIGRPIRQRLFTELKKKAATRALTSNSGQEDSS